MGYEPSTKELRDWARWSRLSASPGAALAIERVERETDVQSILAGIQVPTLVILGEKDPRPSLSVAFRLLVRIDPHATPVSSERPLG
jgi:pimeloyl-ACP methyl ester carboxylesterase